MLAITFVVVQPTLLSLWFTCASSLEEKSAGLSLVLASEVLRSSCPDKVIFICLVKIQDRLSDSQIIYCCYHSAGIYAEASFKFLLPHLQTVESSGTFKCPSFSQSLLRRHSVVSSPQTYHRCLINTAMVYRPMNEKKVI